MHESDLGVFADAIAEIAVEAGKAILEIYEQDFEVTQKDDASPLTQADLASHRIICDALAELTPDVPVLSEESSDIDWVCAAHRWYLERERRTIQVVSVDIEQMLVTGIAQLFICCS